MLAIVAVAAWLLGAGPPSVAGQEEPAHGPAAQTAPPASSPGGAHDAAPGGHAEQPAAGSGHSADGEVHQAEGEHGEGEHGESPWGLLGRIFNFALLAGGLAYLLKSPFARHLEHRGAGIRSDLAKAREMREDASLQMTKIEERLKALPAEIEALKRRGTSEIAAEQARMREAAEAERRRMIEQARREVESQVRTAERMLLKRAGDLAVNVATERVRRTITDADQARLVERYLTQVGN